MERPRGARDGVNHPIGVLMVALPHFIPDLPWPYKIVAEYGDPMVSGSYPDPADPVPRAPQLPAATTAGQLPPATHPGVTFASAWVPESPADVDGGRGRIGGRTGIGRRG